MGSPLPDKDKQGSWGSGAILSPDSSPLLSSTPSPLLAGPLQGKHLDWEGTTRGGGAGNDKGGMVETGATPSPETDGEKDTETERREQAKRRRRGGWAGQGPRGGRLGPVDSLVSAPW